MATMLRQISSHLCNNLQPNPVVGEGISTNLKGNVAIVYSPHPTLPSPPSSGC